MRDKCDTYERILNAATDIVCEHGLAALGVNHIALKAGVGKPLIYRYFGGIDGVIAALRDKARVQDFVRLPKGNMGGDVVVQMARQLAQNPLALQILAYDLSGQKSGAPEQGKRADIKEAQMAMMMAAICFVLLRSKSKGEWMGFSLNTPNDLAIFEQAAIDLFSKGVS